MPEPRGASLAADLRRIVPLAWPAFVGQIAVLAFSTADTLLIARRGAVDLAALAVGAAAYISVFIGLMGVVLAVGPVAARSFGAGRHRDAGDELRQALWLAFGLAVVGCAALAWPEPFLAVAGVPPAVAAKVRAYTGALAFGLPAALFFAAFRGFGTAVARPKAAMAIQLGGLAAKVPLTALLVHGVDGVASFGVAGCGIATTVVLWGQWLAAWTLLRRDPFYARFGWPARGFVPPRPAVLASLLKLGVPMGLAILVEVTGFTFMAFFIARSGTGAVAAHQIAANLAALLFMLPLALANATGALVAQRLGAGDARDARGLALHGLQTAFGAGAAAGALLVVLRHGVVALYTRDAAIAAGALPLVACVGAFHVCDAVQTMAAFVLRAYRIATLPLAVYAASVWGIGLGGGWALAFGGWPVVPDALRGARGFWVAGTVGLGVAGAGLMALLALRLRARAEGDRR